MTGTGKDKTSAFITSTKDSIILKNSSHCPAANHLPSTAGVHLGNKVQAAVLYSIPFLDQWLFKGHSRPTEAKNPMGKCLARFTHSLSFVFTAHNESLRETHRVKESD